MQIHDHRQRIGFAIGTGIVPGVMALLVIGITSGRWPVAVLIAVVVWMIVAAGYWYRANRPPRPRRGGRRRR